MPGVLSKRRESLHSAFLPVREKMQKCLSSYSNVVLEKKGLHCANSPVCLCAQQRDRKKPLGAEKYLFVNCEQQKIVRQ